MSRLAPVVIVGGGAAGTLVATHLLAQGLDREVIVVEPAERLGEGVAYSTRSPSHLLNVRADGMSAFPDRPGHFTDWARGTGLGLTGTEFLPRMLYARYLRDTLEGMAGAVSHVRARAVGLSEDGRRITLSDGTELAAGGVVLATGNGMAPLAWLPELPGVVRDPWAPGALEVVDPSARVAIVGSGLTAVDVVLSLHDRAHRGRITMASSHGLLPEPHLEAVLPRRAPAVDPDAGPSARALVGALRHDAIAADDWRQTIDGVRSVTVATWRALPTGEQRRALRHGFRQWEVRRHRMAPPVARTLDGMRDAGHLVQVRGRVREVAAADEALVVTLRSAGLERRVPADVVIACVGPSADPLHDPLLAGAIHAGLVERHPLGLGISIDAIGRAVRPDGVVHAHLWTVGSLRKGAEWEVTAVPELRVHARDVAEAIIAAG